MDLSDWIEGFADPRPLGEVAEECSAGEVVVGVLPTYRALKWLWDGHLDFLLVS